MPNYVENWLTIEGSKDNCESVLTAMASPDRPIDFNKVIPYPEHFRILDETRELYLKAYPNGRNAPQDGYNQGGYEWCKANWGTKWNSGWSSGPMRKMKWDDRFDRYDLIFETAWEPPTPVIAELASRFPDVVFTLTSLERGCEFVAEATFNSDCGDESDESNPHEFQGEYKGTRGG